MLQSWLEVLESLLSLSGIWGKHDCHIVVGKEGFGLNVDGCLVILRSLCQVSFSLLNYAKVVVDAHFIAEVALDHGQSLDSFIALIELLLSHGIIGASFLVGP